jgi:hypothetical protein
MRDSENLIRKEVVIEGKHGVVENFWLTSLNLIYMTVLHESVRVNYRLSDLPEKIEIKK